MSPAGRAGVWKWDRISNIHRQSFRLASRKQPLLLFPRYVKVSSGLARCRFDEVVSWIIRPTTPYSEAAECAVAKVV